MKNTETKRVNQSDGTYILYERRIRVKNGMKQATKWVCTFDSKRGY